MFQLASTRFNEDTYKENIDYRKKNNIPVIYGSSVQIRDKILIDTPLFVIEMNNTKSINRIEGIGFIKNKLILDKKYKIYDDGQYNRFIYKGKYWIGRDEIYEMDKEILEICDTILFKGKSHQKRFIGITMVTEKVFKYWSYELSVLKRKIKNLFLEKFIKEELLHTDDCES
jgi:hypothetical protein